MKNISPYNKEMILGIHIKYVCDYRYYLYYGLWYMSIENKKKVKKFFILVYNLQLHDYLSYHG